MPLKTKLPDSFFRFTVNSEPAWLNLSHVFTIHTTMGGGPNQIRFFTITASGEEFKITKPEEVRELARLLGFESK